MLGGYHSVDDNDGAERNEDEIDSLYPSPPRKSACTAMAATMGHHKYFDVLSNELVVNIFHMLTGGPDWHVVHDVEQSKERRMEVG